MPSRLIEIVSCSDEIIPRVISIKRFAFGLQGLYTTYPPSAKKYLYFQRKFTKKNAK
jgi:hypothetical protein